MMFENILMFFIAIILFLIIMQVIYISQLKKKLKDTLKNLHRRADKDEWAVCVNKAKKSILNN